MTNITAIATGLAITIGAVVVPGAHETNSPVVAITSATTNEVVEVNLAPDVVVVGGDPSDHDRLTAAFNRFRDQHLALPDLEIRFFDDDEPCGGHDGLFEPSVRPWRISVCSDVEYVATHELAHAWEAANLDDVDRDRYLGARGLSSWNDHTAPRMERGIEDAAFNLQQNLMASNPPIDSDIWRDRVAAYELLTGAPSPVTA